MNDVGMFYYELLIYGYQFSILNSQFYISVTVVCLNPSFSHLPFGVFHSLYIKSGNFSSLSYEISKSNVVSITNASEVR